MNGRENELNALVAVRACPDYDEARVQEAVDSIFALCGGIESVVSPGMRVLVKVNLLMRRAPERATTTHPAVARAVVRAVQRAGGVPVLADSPGGPFTRALLAGVYEECGMRAVAEETGCALNDDFSAASRYFEAGRTAKRLDLIGALEHVDAVISVGKLKTHGLTTMTGCVKNLFGLVPGTTKVDYHARYPEKEVFSDMLVDLCACVSPVFSLLDAVDCMEGEGPSGGRPRRVGALLGGKNPHQVDALAARLIGLKPEEVTTLAAAARRCLLGPLETAGDDWKALRPESFQIPMRLGRLGMLDVVTKLPRVFGARPVFTHRRCDGCGTCARACPAKAIRMGEDRRPRADLKKCVRCFCCQELCPKTDVAVRRNPLFALLK